MNMITTRCSAMDVMQRRPHGIARSSVAFRGWEAIWLVKHNEV
jgi:hypothetical protein